MLEKTANPRLIDVFGLPITQEDVDFAIPRLLEDIPLYVDPFLLWSSSETEHKELHDKVLSFFELIRQYVVQGKIDKAAEMLAGCEETKAVGLGYASGSKKGTNIGPKLIANILYAFEGVQQLKDGHLRHFEELQLVVRLIAEDRISDTTIAILKDFFIEYTSAQAREYKMPTRKYAVGNIFDFKSRLWVPAKKVALPYNPIDSTPILLVPLNLLRHLPWINYGDYYRTFYKPYVVDAGSLRRKVADAAVKEYNARNYVEIERYVDVKEKTAGLCKPDPLFKPLTLSTLKKKYKELRELPTGSSDKADRRFEDLVYDLFSSLLYPTFEFAQSSVRTVDGVHIRDLIFYNDGKTVFAADIRERYDARQPVFELKNVKSLSSTHVNQLYRYLDEEFGRFGILVTRNPTPKAVVRNLVDLHSSKRVIILCLDDSDIELMFSLLDAGMDPVDVIKKRYVEFVRLLPK